MVYDNYLVKYHNDLVSFWLHGGPIPDRAVQDFCDMIYSLHLIGKLEGVQIQSCSKFIESLKEYKLPGWSSTAVSATNKSLSVHNFAYLLGTLNILKKYNIDLYPDLFCDRVDDVSEIIDQSTFIPKYPKWLTHHNWRVSHWIGGVPSILFSLGNSSISNASHYKRLGLAVLDVVNEELLSPKTGLIKLYKFDVLQKLFRSFYRLRHDPDLGDLGGVAHVLWINHFENVDYVANDWLLNESISLFKKHEPFMERVPYCLDFDIVQIVRTCLSQSKKHIDIKSVKERAIQMMKDIDVFYENESLDSYTLHKVPGALATYHECAFILGEEKLKTYAIDTVDIIKDAYWL